MKLYLKAFVSLILITAVLCQINFTCSAVTKGKKLFSDNSGVTLISYNESKVYETKLVPDNYGYTYSFSSKVVDSCAVYGKVYILCLNSSRQNSAYIYSAEKGNISNPKIINKIKLNNSGKISVDSNGNYLITNSANKIQVYNQAGKYIKTYDNKTDNILQMSRYIIVVSGNKLYKVTASGFTHLYEGINTSIIYKISDDYIADYYGNIYCIKNGFKKVINSSAQGLYNAAETDKNIIVYTSKRFDVYSKNDFSYLYSVKYYKKVFGITSYKNNAAVIKKYNSTYKCELLSQSFFNKNNNNSSDSNTNNQSTTPEGINLKTFKYTGKYIYVNSGLTIAAFKNKISYNGYNISFGNRKSGIIRTNADIKFTKGNYSKSYKFVVLGDVTGEGNVNSRDESAMFDHLLGIKELKGAYKTAGDLNCDNKLKNADLLLLAKMIK